MHFHGNATLGSGLRISIGHEGTLEVGEGVANTGGCAIVCHEGVTIGDGDLISWDTLIMDTDFHRVGNDPVSVPVAIGSHVWIGCRSPLFKGARASDGSVVAD